MQFSQLRRADEIFEPDPCQRIIGRFAYIREWLADGFGGIDDQAAHPQIFFRRRILAVGLKRGLMRAEACSGE